MNLHRGAAKTGTSAFYTAMRDIGIDKFYIELCEDYPCERREQLTAREGAVIREHIDKAYNKKIEGRSKREYRADNADSIKQYNVEYREANADSIKQQRAEYRAANADSIKKQNAEYREANAAKIKQKNAEYYAAHKKPVSFAFRDDAWNFYVCIW